jgi:hypothetical protein
MMVEAVRIAFPEGSGSGGSDAPPAATAATAAVIPQIGVNRNTPLNRIALLAEVMIHDECRTLLEFIHTKPEGSNLPSFLDAGPKLVKAALYDALVRKANGEVRQTVFNMFTADHVCTAQGRMEGNDAYQQIRDINPQLGEFKDGAEFRELETCMCNLFTTLKANLSASGWYSAGENILWIF